MRIWVCSTLAAVILCFFSLQTEAEETGDEADPAASKYASMNKTEYEAEVIKLETWKANVQHTDMGKRLMKVLTQLDASIVLNHRDTNSLYKRAYLYGTIGCTRAALVDLIKALKIDPVNPSFHCERAICYIDMGEYSKAENDLNSAIEQNPNSGDALLARGRLYLLLNKPDLALKDLLASKNPHSVFNPALPDEVPANFYNAPDYYLGVCYDQLGQHDKALSHYNESAKDVTGADSGYLHRYADRPQTNSAI